MSENENENESENKSENENETDHKEAGPVGHLDPPLRPHLSLPPRKSCAAYSSRHRTMIASATTISAEAVLGLRPPPPTPASTYRRLGAPPSLSPMLMRQRQCSCAFPLHHQTPRPPMVTADGNPSKPHRDANTIIKGNAEMKTP
jgi:hypothetical protein